MSRGERLGPKLVIDNQGRATTDPSVMYKEPRGSLLPFGDHKGSGFALMCELLAGGFSGGTIQPDNPRQESIVNNMFTLLIDPERLVDIDWLNAEIDATVSYVKSAQPAENGQSRHRGRGPGTFSCDRTHRRRHRGQRRGVERNDGRGPAHRGLGWSERSGYRLFIQRISSFAITSAFPINFDNRQTISGSR